MLAAILTPGYVNRGATNALDHVMLKKKKKTMGVHKMIYRRVYRKPSAKKLCNENCCIEIDETRLYLQLKDARNTELVH